MLVRITSNANWFVVVFTLNRPLLVGTRERVLITNDAILFLWIELNRTTEGIQRVQTLLKTEGFLSLNGLSVVVVMNLKLVRLYKHQVSTRSTTSVLSSQAVIVIVINWLKLLGKGD